jgi:hypothetical protein
MQDEFPFDVLGVEESVDEVLAYFGFFAQLSEIDQEELRCELTRLAEASEWAEMAYLVEQEVSA